jgi:two-component system OmpR family sensor kinase
LTASGDDRGRAEAPGELRRAGGRLPLRVRLTLAFALVMAVVLTLTGLFLHSRFRADLNGTIEGSLSSRSDAVTVLVRESRGQLDYALAGAGGDDDVAQVLNIDGGLLASTPQGRGHPLIAGATLRRARRGPTTTDVAHAPGFDGPLRLRARPVDRGGEPLVVVVGTGLDDRNDELRALATLLVLGGGVALALASLAGYAVAAAALRPVESMRRRAAAIAPATTGQRLPVPPARDEIGRLGETLNDMLARLEAAFARERTFVADASHELRTPLSILKAELELAVREGRSPEELRAALESAAEETDRLVRLAEDLLVIARLDQGRVPLRPVDTDATDLLATVAARFEARANAAGRSVSVSNRVGAAAADDERAVVHGDRVRLEQALGNLVDNALRHGAGDVRLAARPSADGVELHVVDAGPGLAPDFMDHAFERFARADGARSRGGAGLGLAIVAAVASSHGGSARAANLPGGGADVWIHLPRGGQSSDVEATTSPVAASTLTSLSPTSTLKTSRPE